MIGKNVMTHQVVETDNLFQRVAGSVARRWSTIGLRAKMAILVAIGTISMISLFAYLGTAALSENTQRNLQERVVLAQMTAGYIDSLIENVQDRLAYTVSEEYWADRAQTDFALDQTYQRLSFLASRVILVDRTGRVVAAKPAMEPGVTLKDLTPVIAVLNGIPFSVSHVPQPLNGKGSGVVAAAPIRDSSGNVSGALVIPLSFTTPNNHVFTHPIGLGQTGYMDLVALNGQILASTRPDRVGSESDHGFSLMALIRDHRQSVSACHDCHATTVEAEPRRAEMLAFAPLDQAQWGITIRQAEDEVFAPTHLLQSRIYALLVIMLGGALVLVYLTTRSVIVPVQALTQATRRIAAGDLDSPVETFGENEVGVLARAFDEMRLRLKYSSEEIQQWNRELDARVQDRTAAYQDAARENERLYKELERKEQLRGELLRRVISAQEDERKRIARELHDETSQGLSALLVGLDTVQMASGQDIQKANTRLQHSKSIAEALLKNIHRLVADLRPTLLDDLGLVPAIAWYGEQRLTPLGIAFHMDEAGLESRLQPSVETALFRIVQEALTNIMRHSQATEVTARLFRTNGCVTCEITDNGQGFDPQILQTSGAHGKGLGLRGMQERASILGGELQIRTAPSRGTTITVRVPMMEEVEHEKN